MKPVLRKIEEFVTQFKLNKDGTLDILLLDRCPGSTEFVGACVEIIKDANSSTGDIAGIKLWGVKEMLLNQGYKKRSIPLTELIRLFKLENPPRLKLGLFGKYEKHVMTVIESSDAVWEIPK
jgi:hypothetical protein